MNVWRSAAVAAIIAILALIALCLRWSGRGPTRPVLAQQSPPQSPPVAAQYTQVAVPPGWQTLPIITQLDPSNATSTFEDGFLEGTRRSRALLGDLVVTWDARVCTAGGSACGVPIASFENLRINGLATGLSCRAAAPFETVPKERRKACSLERLALRQSGDDQTLIVSYADPDEKSVIAFHLERRSASVGHARDDPQSDWVSSDSQRSMLSTFPFLLLAIGGTLLRFAHRYWKRQGILRWSEAEISDGVLRHGNALFRVDLGRFKRGAVLVHPHALEARERERAYRAEAPPLERQLVVTLSHGAALARARLLALTCLLCCTASALATIVLFALS